jgi:Domain of unknown function (DUF4326)
MIRGSVNTAEDNVIAIASIRLDGGTQPRARSTGGAMKAAGSIEVIDVRCLHGEERAGVEYVGRAFAGWPESPLGNRAGDIPAYRRWLWEQVKAEQGPAYNELRRLVGQVAGGERIRLGCWCAPNPCHADVVKACVEWMVD